MKDFRVLMREMLEQVPADKLERAYEEMKKHTEVDSNKKSNEPEKPKSARYLQAIREVFKWMICDSCVYKHPSCCPADWDEGDCRYELASMVEVRGDKVPSLIQVSCKCYTPAIQAKIGEYQQKYPTKHIEECLGVIIAEEAPKIAKMMEEYKSEVREKQATQAVQLSEALNEFGCLLRRELGQICTLYDYKGDSDED